MTDKEFSEMFKVGDFVVHHNKVCSVESFGLTKTFSTEADGYVLQPLLNKFFKDRKWIIQKRDVQTYKFCNDSWTSPSVATDAFLLEELADSLNISVDFGEKDDEGFCVVSDEAVCIFMGEDSMYLTPKNAIEVRDIINRFVGEK
jgi:hypothetical protein